MLNYVSHLQVIKQQQQHTNMQIQLGHSASLEKEVSELAGFLIMMTQNLFLMVLVQVA